MTAKDVAEEKRFSNLEWLAKINLGLTLFLFATKFPWVKELFPFLVP